MKRMLRVAFMLLASLSLAATGLADTLVLKNGTRVYGLYEGGTARIIKFRTDAGLRDYDLLSIERLVFGDEYNQPASSADARSDELRDPVRLRSRNEARTPPRSTTAADVAYVVPEGSGIIVRMIDAIDSETDKEGTTFAATLEEPVIVDNVEVVPRGADVRGRIVEVDDAGRLTGSSELRLELTQIVVNGIPYSMTTDEYAEIGESRTGQTARRVGTAAGIGALIGVIAGGGKGAAIGAGVGAGAAGTVQVLTKGEELFIPAETVLGFKLKESLSIAAR